MAQAPLADRRWSVGEGFINDVMETSEQVGLASLSLQNLYRIAIGKALFHQSSKSFEASSNDSATRW